MTELADAPRTDPGDAWMSDAEAIMWAVEKDPSLRSDFTNITVLDRLPDERRLRTKVDRALREIPRLAQRVVSAPLRIAPPRWRADPTLDIAHHLRRVAVPPPGGTRELLDLAALLSSSPLDRSRPLWEFTLVEGLAGGRAALLQRVHHTITDGVGGLKLSLSLVDLEPEPPLDVVQTEIADTDPHGATDAMAPPAATRVGPRVGPMDVVGDAIGYALTRDRALLRRSTAMAGDVMLHPQRLPGRVAGALRLTASVRRQVLVTQAARSPLLGARSLGRRFEIFSIPLEGAHAAANALGGSVNDLFVAGVAGALGLYHERMGVPVDELRMAMPVSTRGEADLAANRFAPSRVVVPVAPKDTATRFAVVRERLASVRDEPALAAADSLSAFLALLPTALLVSATRNQARTIDFATSNLRGSPVDLYLGGARIEANYPMGPRAGCALNVTVLSYCGWLHMGLNLDPAAITDPAALLECFDESYGALLVSSA